MYNLIKVNKVIKKRKIDIVKYLDKNLDIYLKKLEHNPSIFVDSFILKVFSIIVQQIKLSK